MWSEKLSGILEAIRSLVYSEELRISEHGYDELAADNISVRDIVEGVVDAVMVEEYPEYPKGSCVLVLQRDRSGQPVHAVWGIPAGNTTPAVLITAYRPDPERWDPEFIRRCR